MRNTIYRENEVITGTNGKRFIVTKYSGPLSCFECIFSVRSNPNFDNLPSCNQRRIKYLGKHCSCTDLVPVMCTFKGFFEKFKEGI